MGPERLDDDQVEVFAAHRPVVVGLAYRILGSVADAEDVAQEAWLRWSRADTREVRDPRAYLVRVGTRLALDRLRRVKALRESYVGPWLPEPFATAADPEQHAETADPVSMALLVVLETLSPLERAVFVLREAFGYSHAEIAEILDRSEPAVRQLSARAHAHVKERRPRFDADLETRHSVTERFLRTSTTGDVEGLLALLAPGVTLVSDAGGRARAPRVPIVGADKVARFLVSVAAQPVPDLGVSVVGLNGGPGVLVTSGRVVITAFLLDVEDGMVSTIYLVANPDKLQRLEASPRA